MKNITKAALIIIGIAVSSAAFAEPDQALLERMRKHQMEMKAQEKQKAAQAEMKTKMGAADQASPDTQTK